MLCMKCYGYNRCDCKKYGIEKIICDAISEAQRTIVRDSGFNGVTDGWSRPLVKEEKYGTTTYKTIFGKTVLTEYSCGFALDDRGHGVFKEEDEFGTKKYTSLLI